MSGAILRQMKQEQTKSGIPDEHVEYDVAGDDVWVVESSPHVVERCGQVVARVRLTQLPQVRKELLFHVNPEISISI